MGGAWVGPGVGTYNVALNYGEGNCILESGVYRYVGMSIS